MELMKTRWSMHCFVFFFFQAEDGIRDVAVTGVQTCALPIFPHTTNTSSRPERLRHSQRKYFRISSDALSLPSQVVLAHVGVVEQLAPAEIGRASCRERV